VTIPLKPFAKLIPFDDVSQSFFLHTKISPFSGNFPNLLYTFSRISLLNLSRVLLVAHIKTSAFFKWSNVSADSGITIQLLPYFPNLIGFRF
jgi:hypothetical protein